MGDPGRVLRGMTSPQRARFDQLCTRYDLRRWPTLCGRDEYIENLYVLDVLDRCLRVPHGSRGIEIGCRNFSYLPALHSFAPLAWDGVELDAYARYWNGRTRQAYGDYMAAQFPGCRYLPASLLDITGCYDLIVWFLPFVFLDPLLSWGLPRRFFAPRALLERAAGLLAFQGQLLIINQGAHEADEQQRLCESLGLSCQALGEVDSMFSPFRKTRFGFLLRGPAQHANCSGIPELSIHERAPSAR